MESILLQNKHSKKSFFIISFVSSCNKRKAQQPAEIICCFSIQAYIKVNYSTPKSSPYLLFDYSSFSQSQSHPSHSSFSFQDSHLHISKPSARWLRSDFPCLLYVVEPADGDFSAVPTGAHNEVQMGLMYWLTCQLSQIRPELIHLQFQLWIFQ